ncbi:MAG: phosphatidylglycerophosphatase A [Planctomycetaceae bacterium]|jgi:phosphatidylglycerophosphatase A
MATCECCLPESIEQMEETNRNPLIDRLSVTLGTGFGIGFAPFAPGTFGSLLGPPLVWGVLQAGLPLPAVLGIAAVFIAVGIPICTAASAALGKHDPGQVVYDEIAAFWIVFLPHILFGKPIGWLAVIGGFAFFRVFDIAKPWPICRLEKLPDGLGIMADDLAAGVFAAACLFTLEEVVARFL